MAITALVMTAPMMALGATSFYDVTQHGVDDDFEPNTPSLDAAYVEDSHTNTNSDSVG